MQKVIDEINKLFSPVSYICNISPDGNFYRFDHKKLNDKAIWVVGSTWTHKSNVYSSFNFGSWKNGDEKFCVNSWNEKLEQDSEFKKIAKREQKKLKEKIDLENKFKHDECVKKWKPIYESLPEKSELHPYMQKKGFKENGIARISSNGSLIIPAFNNSGFVGVQIIYEKEGTFEKRYSGGIEKKGSFCPIGDLKSADCIYVCEGYATALSIYLAMGSASVCAWDCNNIKNAISSIKNINSKAKIIICADNDANKIGENKAREAAKIFSNCIVRVAKFGENRNPSWTDFNDIYNFIGIDEIKKQLDCSFSDFAEIILKGYKNNDYFYYSTETRTIYKLDVSQHTESQFLSMAEPKYWGDKYRYKKDNDGGQTWEPDWKYIKWNIFKQQRKQGFFSYEKIRGYGVHRDNCGIVVNLGNYIYANNELRDIHNIGFKSKYFYEANNGVEIDFSDQLSDWEGAEIVEAFKSIPLKKKSDYIFLAGWVAHAQVAGAQKWRSHLWPLGSKGSGKTTIMSWVMNLVPFSIKAKDSTAAGVKQRVLNSSQAVFYDEAEPNSDIGKKRMDQMIELARQCSSLDDAEILRGTVSGNYLDYRPNMIFFMSSIQKYLPTSADTSRFYPIEMDSPKNHNQKSFKDLESKMEDISIYGKKLFARMVVNFKIYEENVEIVKSYLKAMGYESRQCDQLSNKIAGFFMITSLDIVTEKKIESIMNQIKLSESEYIADNEIDESQKCLDTILDLMLPSRQTTVLQIVEKSFNPMVTSILLEDDLTSIGIKCFPKTKEIFISGNHHQLKKLLDKTIYSDYVALLRRHEKVNQKRNICRIAGKVRKGVSIFIGDIDGSDNNINEMALQTDNTCEKEEIPF